MIAFFVNYSTVAFPLHLPTLKRQQFFGAVANSLGKNSYFPLPLDVWRCVLYYVITKIQSSSIMCIRGARSSAHAYHPQLVAAVDLAVTDSRLRQ